MKNPLSPQSPLAPSLLFISLLLSFLPFLENCTANIPVCPPTPTPVSLTATPTLPPGCTLYTDNFSVDSLANFDILDGYWAASTASAQSVQITSGEFQVAPPSVVYPYFILKNSAFDQTLGDYTVEGTFQLDTVAQGVFGLVFRSNPASSQGYIFQWNGLNSRWEIEKQTGPAVYDYVGTSSSPAYVLGTSIVLKVVVSGSTFTASIDSGGGPQVLFSGVSDPFPSPAPYTAGRVGIRTYNVAGGNILHLDNFSVKTPACP